ncbi:MAG TPA: hypothetical protein VII92_15125, partial [Anaerolineae bacterium]
MYLPLVLRNFGTMLYDDFNNPIFNGTYDSSKWSYSGLLGYFTVKQQSNALVFTNTNLPGPTGADMIMLQPGQRTLRQLQQFEARLKVSSAHVGGYAFVKLQIWSDNIAGHGWFTQCRLGASSPGSQPQFLCDVVNYSGGTMNFEYTSSGVAASYDTWYTARIEADPSIAQLRFYLNGSLVGTYTPTDALYLLTASNLQPQVG